MLAAHMNPYIRAAQIQPAVLEGSGERCAYDHRLFCILRGEGELYIEGECYTLRPDTLIFIPPETGYRFCGRMSVVVLNFDMTRSAEHRPVPICPPLREKFDPARLFDPTRVEELSTPTVLPDKELWREAVLQLVKEWHGGGTWRDAATSAALKALLTELLKHRTPELDPAQRLCARVSGYIRLHAAELSDNATLAAQFGYHPVYLGELFKKSTGQTLHAAITAEKIRLAKDWLLRTDASVEEIAAATGFATRAHLCTVFRRTTGETPLAWRKKQVRG